MYIYITSSFSFNSAFYIVFIYIILEINTDIFTLKDN